MNCMDLAVIPAQRRDKAHPDRQLPCMPIKALAED